MGDLTTLKAPDGDCEAYVAYPDSPGTFPGVVFFMDGLGFRPTVHRMADRMAANGYVVLLPNLFYRYGPAKSVEISELLKPENRPQLIERVGSMTPHRVVDDAGCFLDFLKAHPRVSKDMGAGLVGYCMGGSMVIRAAAAYAARVVAGASFHAGRLATDDFLSPHHLVSTVRAELYFGHADQDAGMPPEAIQRLELALTTSGARYRSEVYSGTLHGFTMKDLVTIYNEQADERHWRELLALFARNLQNSKPAP